MSEEERITILNYICKNYSLFKKLEFQRMEYPLKEENDEIPPIIWEIKKRIIKAEGLEGHIQEPIFKDFIGVILPGGRIHEHIDENNRGLIHTRFNVMILVPNDGCKLYYAGQSVVIQERAYALCRSGIDEHYTTLNEDSYPRISLSFGFLLPIQKLAEISPVLT